MPSENPGGPGLTLSGGEVFLRPDLWELVDALIDGRMRYSLLTNGTLITDKTVGELMREGRRRRLDSIQVSIDGSCAAVHDASRGNGSFERALRGLRLLKAAGLPVTARVTVNQHNVDDLERAVRLLLDDVGLARVGTNDAMPMGTGCAHRQEVVLTPAQRVTAMDTLVRLEREYPGRIQASAGSLALWHMFREMEEARATGRKTRRWKMGFLSSCGCMFAKLAVHHEGMIVPCNMLAAPRWAGSARRPSAPSGRTTRCSGHAPAGADPHGPGPRLQDCEWAPYCSGGCPAAEYTRTGEMNVANPECCSGVSDRGQEDRGQGTGAGDRRQETGGRRQGQRQGTGDRGQEAGDRRQGRSRRWHKRLKSWLCIRRPMTGDEGI